MARMAGRTKSSKVTMALTGLPGSPIHGTPSTCPKPTGAPGRIRSFQKSRRPPISSTASRRWSCSPTLIPAEVTRRSHSGARARCSRTLARVSRARPRLSGSPPARRTSAPSVWLLELATFRPLRISSGWSTSTISSPPPRMPTRGRRKTSGCATASDASTPSSAAPSSVPAGSTVSPRRMSSPAWRMLTPTSRSLRISTTSDPKSVSSCRITVSAPAGSGAPVKIRAHSPGRSVREGKAPAGICSTTRSRTGASGEAPRTSAPRAA